MRAQTPTPGPPTKLAGQAPTEVAVRAPTSAGRDEWLRFVPAWHAVMGGLAVVTGALVATDDGIGRTARYIGLTLLALLAGWYAILGARALRRDPSWCGPAYLAVAAPLTIGLLAAAPVGSLMLLALYPHLWAMLQPRRAIVATAVVVGGVSAAFLARDPLDRSSLAGALVLGAVSLVVALLLGLWVARIIEQSHRRAELLAELAETRAELAVVSRDAGVLAERERLAHEIHDTLAQGFTSILLMLEAVETALGSDLEAALRHLNRARDTARENLAEARALVAALTPPDLTRTSLPEALRRLVDRADAEPGASVVLSVTGTPRGLPAEHEVVLLRAAQEALTNVRRHADATRVELSLVYTADLVSLRVCDNGRGFDPAIPRDGYGLAVMRARADRIGGVVSVTGTPGVGVAVRLDVPTAGG